MHLLFTFILSSLFYPAPRAQVAGAENVPHGYAGSDNVNVPHGYGGSVLYTTPTSALPDTMSDSILGPIFDTMPATVDASQVAATTTEMHAKAGPPNRLLQADADESVPGGFMQTPVPAGAAGTGGNQIGISDMPSTATPAGESRTEPSRVPTPASTPTTNGFDIDTSSALSLSSSHSASTASSPTSSPPGPSTSPLTDGSSGSNMTSQAGGPYDALRPGHPPAFWAVLAIVLAWTLASVYAAVYLRKRAQDPNRRTSHPQWVPYQNLKSHPDDHGHDGDAHPDLEARMKVAVTGGPETKMHWADAHQNFLYGLFPRHTRTPSAAGDESEVKYTEVSQVTPKSQTKSRPVTRQGRSPTTPSRHEKRGSRRVTWGGGVFDGSQDREMVGMRGSMAHGDDGSEDGSEKKRFEREV